MKSPTFVDRVTLYAQGGNGGNGCVSFRREKFEPRGGPDGGDGGHGGSVVLQSDRDTDSLLPLFYAPHQRAGHGGHGRGKQQRGGDGADRVVRVPCGTEVWDSETGEQLDDLVAEDRRWLAARGGAGGLGNVHWKSAVHRAPREHTDGEPGESRTLRLEFKLVADAGLIGFPNAGKSSLLAGISDAHPKVAAYPFTTLNPVVGTVIFEDYSRVTVADVPGLIENAHRGVGLGDTFLRHVERARVQIFVIDMAGLDGRKPEDDYRTLRRELELYRPDLAERTALVAANKMDCPPAADNLERFAARTGTRPIPVSALQRTGLDALRAALRTRFTA
ncbi:MAG: GTPase ObgE [Lentisphaerae bacterium]|nr:GTPase ObgE [Lentisphaerota bacterium]